MAFVLFIVYLTVLYSQPAKLVAVSTLGIGRILLLEYGSTR